MTLKPVSILNVDFELNQKSVAVGRMALKDRRVWFEYDPAFLGSGLELSPFKLPLKPGIATPAEMVFEGLFGVFNDSLPDGWGRLLLDRQMRGQGVAPESLTVLDRLAHVGKNGMGALTYEPDYSPDSNSSDKLELDRLALESRSVLEGSPGDVLELLTLNGSSAGARPKIMAGVNKDKSRIVHGVQDLPKSYDHWLIKFSSSADPTDNGAIEYAYSLMARAAGVIMPQTHLFPASKGAGYFGVRRFDRVGNTRLHVHTVSGLLHADHRLPSLDYEDILRAAMALTKSMPEVETLFRQIAFNVLAHNRDDHAKNFAFLMEADGTWRMAPAYDLIFSSGPAGEHSTTVLGEGKNPDQSHLKKLGQRLDIRKTQEIIEQVSEALFKWKIFATQAGVSKESRNLIDSKISN